jgi:hypothetical protein
VKNYSKEVFKKEKVLTEPVNIDNIVKLVL